MSAANMSQVLFTADLKSFSTYGLPTPSPSVSPEKSREKGKMKALPLTLDPTSSPVRPAKRKRSTEKRETRIIDEVLTPPGHKIENGNLADRVKRRRRQVPTYVDSVPA
jgi:N-glycosylase/DNA lyase